MKKALFFILGSLAALSFSGCGEADSRGAGTAESAAAENLFSYEFTERPKVGDVILKLRLADGADGNAVSAFAEYDMPSMRGHHASGKVEFKRNRAGDFVLPIHFAMRGDWEIVLTLEKDGAEISRRVVNLDI